MNQLEELKRKYEEIQEKNKELPKFELLEEGFDLDGATLNIFSEINKPLRIIRRTIINYYNFALTYLHDFIYPNRQSAILMEEYKSISDKKRDEVVQIISEIMVLVRQNTSLTLNYSEKQEIKFIVQLYSKWLKLKLRINEINLNNIDFWKNYKQ
jgi:hypothetical protein